MKKIIALLLTLCIAFSLCACGSPKTVPEKMLDWEVQDFLSDLEKTRGKYTDYKTKISHNSDSKTKTDTVDLELTITYPRYTAKSSYSATYQYDKSSELWTKLRSGSFSDLQATRMDISAKMSEWETAILDMYYDAEFEENFQSFAEWLSGNLDTQRISEICSGISNEWDIYGYSERTDFMVKCACMRSEQAAKDMFSLFTDSYEIVSSAVGEDFEYAWLNIWNYKMPLIRNGNNIFLIAYDGPLTMEDEFYSSLADVGVILKSY